MKNILKKKNIWIISTLMIIVVVSYGLKVYSNTITNTAFAASISKGDGKDGKDGKSCNGTSGNLYGYIDTDNLGRIYLSTESWNDENVGNTTTTNFSVNYDRQMGIWSGRGWAAGTNATGAIGWVDFSYDQVNHKVRFVIPGNDYDNHILYTWGNWNAIVDLSRVNYSSQNGSFQGLGSDSHQDTGGIFSDLEDDPIGSSTWTFDHVQFQDPACPEHVNLFLNGTSYLHKNKCDIEKTLIQWTTENVTNCTATAGLWTLNTSRPTQNTGTSVHANASITEANTPVIFKLTCTGLSDNQPVVGTAIASCGTLPPCEGDNCPFNTISPVLIEA